ncbi:MAG TPA: Xaa-Pro peptidase family protein [Edaphobacter sp.]|nr:Xaa-Pro peptidase family protein [Edaphobacter sp.]
MPSRRSFLLAASAAAAAPSFPLQAQRPSGFSLSSLKLPPAITALTNLRSEAVPITLEEREHRIEHARELMAQNKIDALVICAGTSLSYFTGLRWGQSERLFAWVLPVKGSPFVVCPVFEEGRVHERMEARPATLPQASVTRVYAWNEDEDPYAVLAKALKETGITTGKVGVEERTQFAFSDGIAHASPALTAISGTPITAGCRSVKSPAELALMRLANDNTLKVYEAVWKSLEPGMTNRHVSELISAAYVLTGFPGDASCQVGEYSALPHGSLQPQVIREGQIILLDDGCLVEGYQSDMSRSFVLGKATDKQKRVFDIVHKAQSAALAAGKVGAPCHAVDDVARKVITDAGFGPGYKYFSHRLGHGIGMDMHEWPYLVRGNNTKLESGMTFSDEPGIYIVGEFGIRLEDDWVVTPNGGDMFTPQSLSLEQPFARS